MLKSGVYRCDKDSTRQLDVWDFTTLKLAGCLMPGELVIILSEAPLEMVKPRYLKSICVVSSTVMGWVLIHDGDRHERYFQPGSQ